MGLCASRTIHDGTDVPGRRFNKKERQFLEQFLPSFKDVERVSTKKDQETISDHWDYIVKQVKSTNSASSLREAANTVSLVQIFDNFYSFLFDIAPEVKPLFRSSLQVQSKALIAIITEIKAMLSDPDMVKRCSDLAERHVKYGVKPAFFDDVGVALLLTFKKCTGEERWTEAVSESWRKVYVHVSLVVIENLEKRLKRSENSAGSRSLTSLTLHSSVHESVRSLRHSSKHSSNGRQTSTRSSGRNHSMTRSSDVSGREKPDAVCPFSGNKLSEMQRTPSTRSTQVSTREKSEAACPVSGSKLNEMQEAEGTCPVH